MNDQSLAFEDRVDWNEERLKKEWNSWNDTDREVYLYWMEAYKPHESRPLEAAQCAAHRVLAWRRVVGVRKVASESEQWRTSWLLE